MKNCLFNILSFDEYIQKGYDIPTVLMCGYGFNQKAFTEMAWGYKKAADLLAQSQIELGKNSQDVFLYPIFFCYRQSVELILKAILLNCKLPFNRSMTVSERNILSGVIKTHELLPLFKEIKNSLNPIQYHNALEELCCYIESMHKFDPSSFYMRYPTDSKLIASSYHKQITGFDIQYTKDKFGCFWSLLLKLYSQSEADWSKDNT